MRNARVWLVALGIAGCSSSSSSSGSSADAGSGSDLGSGSGSGSGSGTGPMAVTISNDETAAIDNIYLSPTGWTTNDDLLGGSALAPGDSITVDVFCDLYDVELTGSNVNCYVSSYEVCADNDVWMIDNLFLEGCSATQP